MDAAQYRDIASKLAALEPLFTVREAGTVLPDGRAVHSVTAYAFVPTSTAAELLGAAATLVAHGANLWTRHEGAMMLIVVCVFYVAEAAL